MKILVIDNYDSFTYNLVYQLRQMQVSPDVFRNDRISPEECAAYDGLVLSPGPGIPKEAGRLPEIIQRCADSVPILGICLGHQAIAEYLGAQLVQRKRVLHGIQTPVRLVAPTSELFFDFPREFPAGRYHSWEVSKEDLPTTIRVTAEDEDGCILALQARNQALFGVQFHPESILTPLGPQLLKNFVERCQIPAL